MNYNLPEFKNGPSQLDRGIVETNFWYRTWNFQYLCIFSSSIQWCGSNIDFLLCQYNKNEKNKTNYLVTTHERFWFGTSFYINGFIREKSNLQHCQSIFSRAFWPIAHPWFFLSKTWLFLCSAGFSLKTFHQNVVIAFPLMLSEGFLHLTSFYTKKKERFDF